MRSRQTIETVPVPRRLLRLGATATALRQRRVRSSRTRTMVRCAAGAVMVAAAAGLGGAVLPMPIGSLVRAARAAPASASVARAAGDLTPLTARSASGTFEVVETVTRSGRTRPGFTIRAAGLDASRDESGRRTPHGAFLIPVGGGDEVFLGRVRVSGKGDGRLARRDASGLLSALELPLRRQSGATIEVRGPAGPVLRGTLPTFVLDGAGARTDRRETFGLFVPISSQTPRSRPGRFTLRTDAHASGEIRNRAVIDAAGLPATSTYTVWLFGPRTVVLGNMQNHPHVGATLSLDSRRSAIPGGVVRWSEFDGGRIEVRRGGTVMLRGAIATFHAADERVAETGWARTRATVELTPEASGGPARGTLTASVRTLPRRRLQEIRVRAFDLPAGTSSPGARHRASTRDGELIVSTVEDDGARHEIGRIVPRGAARAAYLRVTTRRGDATPPGGVLGQAGRRVEVTDAAGGVILSGTFPALD